MKNSRFKHINFWVYFILSIFSTYSLGKTSPTNKISSKILRCDLIKNYQIYSSKEITLPTEENKIIIDYDLDYKLTALDFNIQNPELKLELFLPSSEVRFYTQSKFPTQVNKLTISAWSRDVIIDAYCYYL